MITYLEHIDIDQEKWDACVRDSQQPMIYAFAWYLNIVCPGWDALVAGDYEAVFPVTWEKKYTVYYIYQPFFTQQLGLFSKSGSRKHNPVAFLDRLPSRFKYKQLCLNESNCEGFHARSFKPGITYHLDLLPPYEILEKGFTVNCRRSLSKAEKENVINRTGGDYQALIHLFRGNQGKFIKRLGESDYSRLETLMQECLNRELGEVWMVRSANGMLLAGAFLMRSPGRIIYHFAASSPEGRNSGAMFQLIRDLIRSYSNKELIFDFEGSNIENLARFFKGFGSRPVTYPCIIINNLPWPIRWLKPSGWQAGKRSKGSSRRENP